MPALNAGFNLATVFETVAETLPDHEAHTHAAQYFVFTDGTFRKPLCKNIPAG